MKILTLNFLTCAVKACKSSSQSFPLHPKDAELVQDSIEMNPLLLVNILPRIDWSALVITSSEVCFGGSFLGRWGVCVLVLSPSHPLSHPVHFSLFLSLSFSLSLSLSPLLALSPPPPPLLARSPLLSSPISHSQVKNKANWVSFCVKIARFPNSTRESTDGRGITGR
jgi:hypothetical protein